MNGKLRTACNLPLPYPEVRVSAPNSNYARLLSVAYAGDGGELAAILQYTYGHIMTENEEPAQLSAVLSCVSMTEMRHLEILGELIYKLGGDPKFCDMQRRGCFDARRWRISGDGCFDASKVNYQTSPEKILRAAIAGEKAAIAMYRDLIRRIDDGCIREILRRIILDEEHHIKIFSELLGTAR